MGPSTPPLLPSEITLVLNHSPDTHSLFVFDKKKAQCPYYYQVTSHDNQSYLTMNFKNNMFSRQYSSGVHYWFYMPCNT